MKEVLVTGGAGFIGTNLVKHLLDKTNWNIVVLDDLSHGNFKQIKELDNYDKKRVSLIKGDIRNKKGVKRAVKGCNYVVNLAAQVGVIESVENPLKDAKINVIGILNVLEACKKEEVNKFVQASSAAALGEKQPPLNEETLPEPLSPYGASKLAGEAYCSAYANSFRLNCVALRFSNVYGPQSLHKDSVIGKFIERTMNEEELVVYGDGKQTRDFVYVKDVCRGIRMALKNDLEDDFELFQLATGKETSINELIKILEDISEKHGYEVPDVRHGEARKGEIKKNYADITKIKKELGFKPSVPVKEGVNKTMDWYVKQKEV